MRVNSSGVVTGTFDQNVSIFGEPDDITSGPDGNLWFTMPNGDSVSRITTNGVVTAFPIADNMGPTGVAGGPDGRIWFLEIFTDRVGRIATDGTGLFETSAGITPDAFLEEIASGPTATSGSPSSAATGSLVSPPA